MAYCQYKKGQKVDAWLLVKCLGAGGNAEVWRAIRNDKQPEYALKILRAKYPNSEPYQRFRTEIDVLHKLSKHPGVLALIDFNLPEKPSKKQPAWLATDIAIPIRNALKDKPLREIVYAVHSVAQTLSELQDHHGIYHRDIKPDNLYQFSQNWCIGDFGLVDFPDKESMTAPGKLLGPKYYLAPELFYDSDSDPGPVDVYALAKTIWVLATNQAYPIPGHMDDDFEQFRIGSYIADPYVRSLEVLVSRATHPDPNQRPTMAYMESELAAWLNISGPTSDPVVTDFARIVKSTVSKQRDKVAKHNHQKQYISQRIPKIRNRLQEEVGAIIAETTGLRVTAFHPQSRAFKIIPELRTILEISNFLASGSTGLRTEQDMVKEGNISQVKLECGIGMSISSTADVYFVASCRVLTVIGKAKPPSGTRWKPVPQSIWTDTRYDLPMESALEYQAVTELLNGLISSLPEALEYFERQLGG